VLVHPIRSGLWMSTWWGAFMWLFTSRSADPVLIAVLAVCSLGFGFAMVAAIKRRAATGARSAGSDPSVVPPGREPGR
jgi:hypothetical protein